MSSIIELTSAIQFAVAPAFLLTAIGSLLSVMTNRLARIIDRYRILIEGQLNNANLHEIENEIILLKLRAKWTHWAIAFTTISALLFCIVIASIFIATEVNFDLHRLIAFNFILSMVILTLGLFSFTREISLSKNVIR